MKRNASYGSTDDLNRLETVWISYQFFNNWYIFTNLKPTFFWFELPMFSLHRWQTLSKTGFLRCLKSHILFINERKTSSSLRKRFLKKEFPADAHNCFINPYLPFIDWFVLLDRMIRWMEHTLRSTIGRDTEFKTFFHE